MFGDNFFMCTFTPSPRGRLVDTFHGKARAFGLGFFLFGTARLKADVSRLGISQGLAILFSLLSGDKKLKFDSMGALLLGKVPMHWL